MDVKSDAFAVESPFTKTRTTWWASTPAEVRRLILGFVCLPRPGEHCNDLGFPKVARFASVCSEWQAFFEARLFRRLVLNPDSVDAFDAIIRRKGVRLGYIRKLWLRVELINYNCTNCDKSEDVATQRGNNLIFSTCIQTLLRTLQLWNPARHGVQGVELMLSASSPSDTEHRFRRCEMKDNYPFHYAEDLDLAGGIVNFHRANQADPITGFLHLDSLPPWSGDHIIRLQGTPLCLQTQNGDGNRFTSEAKNLPVVPMVKGLVLRRQFFRDIHIRTLSWLIGRSFVALEWFRFERTISLEPHTQLYFDRCVRQHLLPSLPKTLRRLSFTQWEIPKNELRYVSKDFGTDISPTALVYLPQEMAKLSQRLDELCPPWQMDTASFLQAIAELNHSPIMVQSCLKRLSLRCALSTPERSRREFETLVILAAKAALSLPQLKVIELWGICRAREESCAYIFRYCYEDGRPRIVWRSSVGAMGVRKRIINDWSEVAQKQSHSTLAYDLVPLEETSVETFKSRGACIYRHLLLKDLMLDAITQKMLENEPYEWKVDDESDESQPGTPLDSNLAPNFASSDQLIGQILDDDFALLQAEISALSNATIAFLQQNHG
ncbi:hypothetical protein MKX08_002593 [Trichoderma sp. CBMAI-0020]|nr:hypothetical protein MKX08_002593 [Trichoderma sp. CBMAI-0020]